MEQKVEVLTVVEAARREGRRVGEVLNRLGVKRSTYYSWRSPRKGKPRLPRVTTVTDCERQAIDCVKNEYPTMRHRQIQGILQGRGLYVSESEVFEHLKRTGQVEPYARRPSPWDEPRFEVIRRNSLWGGDWTRLRIAGLRWYLLALIDYFSRLFIAFGIFPSINSSHVRWLYQEGLRAEGIQKTEAILPELRLDCGSPNKASVTKAFFEELGADLSFCRVRRPTDNARCERLFGTVKQEEIYLVGDYPETETAVEEIGRYRKFYNNERPHQALWNFTPAHVHAVNNKTKILAERKEIKQRTRNFRKAYWLGEPDGLVTLTKKCSLQKLILSI
jgi:putative transposase